MEVCQTAIEWKPEGYLPGNKAAGACGGTFTLHLVLRLRMSGAIPPFPHISLWLAQETLHFHVTNCLPHSRQAVSPVNAVRGNESCSCTVLGKIHLFDLRAGDNSAVLPVVSRFNIRNFDCAKYEVFL